MSGETILKPCPFCSGELEVYEDKNWRSGKIVGYGIIGHQNKCYMYSCEGKTYPTLGHLLETWDKRSDAESGRVSDTLSTLKSAIALVKHREREEGINAYTAESVVEVLEGIKKSLEGNP